MPSGHFTVFRDWKKAFLARRDLERLDGRPLYEYRVTSEEFSELEHLLRTWLGKLIGHFELGQLLRLTGFSALFVLYASQWWSRRYDGSGFSWEPILKDLGVNPDSWTPTQRSQCVREGLATWGLRPREHGALRFLGAVAVQGGLPMRLLSEARGGIGRLLSRALQLAKGEEVARTDFKGWIESLQQWLPKSYRQEIIYELLTDLVLTALKLKQEAKLSPGDDAVALLDQRVCDWKDRFPVSMEDRHAQLLVEQLVRDAANVRVRKVRSYLPVERTLEQGDEGQWSLVSRVELPDTLVFSALTQLFGIEDENCLPRTATLSLIAGENALSTNLRSLAGRNAYRIEPVEFSFVDGIAHEEHLLQLSAPDGRSWRAEAPRGESLDGELPWIFSINPPYELLKQGVGRVADSDVLIALPGHWQYEVEGDGGCELEGSVDTGQRSLFRVRGSVILQSPEGSVSALYTGQAEKTDYQYAWNGNRVWLDFLQPRIAYKGMPRLYRLDDDGSRHPVQGHPMQRVIGNAASNEILGPVILQYPSQGVPQIRTRMLLLPQQAALYYGEVDARGGTVRFSDWGLSTVRVVDSPMVQQECATKGGVTSLNVSVEDRARSPEWISVELLWPHTTSPARIRLPFPASGVRVFDGGGRELQSDSRIAIDNLAGSRIVLNRGGVPSEKLTLHIEAMSQHLSRRYPLHILPGELSTDIALIDYETDIQHLLSLDDSPDSEVMLSVYSNRNQEMFKLGVVHHAALMDQVNGLLALSTPQLDRFEIEQLDYLEVVATRLEYPLDDPIRLKPVLSEGVHTGQWQFNPEAREPGTWLIYPTKEDEIPFRPCIWPIVDGAVADYVNDDDLLNAIANPQQRDREDQILSVIEAMGSDFQHGSWKTVEQLARQFGHLSLTTLDVWRMFVRSHHGMSALVFRLGDLPKNFYIRFGRELPFAWENVSLSAWKQAIDKLREQCRISFPDVGDAIFKAQLEKCLSAVRAESGALSYLLGIAAAAFDEEENKQLYLLREYVAHNAEQELFGGENSKLMFLRRVHAQDEWPTGYGEILNQARGDSEIEKFLFSDQNEYRNGVINLPLIAAIAAILDLSTVFFSTPQSIHLLRTAKAFDPQWFDDAYSSTVARYLIEGTYDV